MPTYSQGTFMPEISALMWHSTDCSNTGITFRFQPLVAYSWQVRCLWKGDECYAKELTSLAQRMLRLQTFLKHLRNIIRCCLPLPQMHTHKISLHFNFRDIYRYTHTPKYLQVKRVCAGPICTLPLRQTWTLIFSCTYNPSPWTHLMNEPGIHIPFI